MKTSLLSIGQNSKLGKKIGVFNLPQGTTCPGATELCKKICYAAKAQRIYKAAAAKRQRNFHASMLDSFAQDMIAEIRDAKLSLVRIHESGDFYNQPYLNAWIEIMKALPGVRFLAYTKSFTLNFSAAPQNLSLLWSTDATTTEEPAAGPRAHILQKGEAVPAGYFTCQPGNMKEHYCGTRCKICWNAKANGRIPGVYFPQH